MSAEGSAGLDDVKPKPDADHKVDTHINIKVTDGSNEVFFKIKRTTPLKKLIDTFCDRQGKVKKSLRFLYDGERIQDTDTPDHLDMQDGDTIEAHQEQVSY